MKIKYYEIVQKRYGNATAFFNKLNEVCQRVGISNPTWAADVMFIETAGTFRADIKNKNSTATGLIQFMQATAVELGTTTLKLAAMSNIEQLDYVERYFKNQIRYVGKKPADFFDVYCLVFYPAWVGKPDSSTLRKDAYRVNMPLDLDKNGTITRGEFRLWAERQIGEISLPIPFSFVF